MNNPETNGKEIQFQVLGALDIDEVFAFAEQRLAVAIPEENDRMFASWQVKWRREALEHYLKLGWSFIARIDGRTVGFFLAQPLMFFRGQTQTVWIEHIEAVSLDARRALADVAIRVGREKHMQRVLFADTELPVDDLKAWKPERLTDQIWEVKTTKG